MWRCRRLVCSSVDVLCPCTFSLPLRLLVGIRPYKMPYRLIDISIYARSLPFTSALFRGVYVDTTLRTLSICAVMRFLVWSAFKFLCSALPTSVVCVAHYVPKQIELRFRVRDVCEMMCTSLHCFEDTFRGHRACLIPPVKHSRHAHT